MSDTEQQFVENSENGHEEDVDFNGDENTEENAENNTEESMPEAQDEEAQVGGEETEEAIGEAIEQAEDSQNGVTDGGQINASKGDEDAGYVLILSVFFKENLSCIACYLFVCAVCARLHSERGMG